jgi:peptide/nickel transport system substrate-binding protein
VAAIRSGRVLAEFRYLSPTHRDDVVRALRDKIQAQEIPLISNLLVNFNCEKKPFSDPRVRRALALAIDQWEGSKILSRISSLKVPGGLLRPGSEFAMTDGELVKIAGFSRDIGASRKEARRLLREAGVPEGFSFEIKNRPPAKDFETMAIWLIDQWRQIGINVTQKYQELGAHFKDLRSGNFEVITHAISDYMDEPDLQFIAFISSDKSPFNYSRYKDEILDDLYSKQSQALDPAERKKLCHQFEKRVLDEMAYVILAPWIHRIVLHSSRMKGWKILPSHFLNQDLVNVWLEKD